MNASELPTDIIDLIRSMLKTGTRDVMAVAKAAVVSMPTVAVLWSTLQQSDFKRAFAQGADVTGALPGAAPVPPEKAEAIAVDLEELARLTLEYAEAVGVLLDRMGAARRELGWHAPAPGPATAQEPTCRAAPAPDRGPA